MIIPLHSFEQYIDEIILKRGLSYFEKGYISEFITLSENEYEAIVEGSEEYTVGLTIENDRNYQGRIDAYAVNSGFDTNPAYGNNDGMVTKAEIKKRDTNIY